MILFLITVFLTIIVFFIYLRKRKETFSNFKSYNIDKSDIFRRQRSDYKIDNISMNNVFDDKKLLDNQKKFPIYIKENIVIRPDYYNANMEIDNDSLQSILNLFISKQNIDTKFNNEKKYTYKYYNDSKIPYINSKVYKNIKNNIITKINNYFENNMYKQKISGKEGELRLFKIINNTILDYKENNEYIKITFLFNIYRKMKYSGFQLYCVCYFNKKEKEYHFKEIKVYGTVESQDIYILPGYDQGSQDNLKIYSSSFPYTSYNGENNYLRTSEISRILPSEKQSKNILENKKKKKILDFIKRSFQCYGSEGNDLYNCISDINVFNQHKTPGIWDRPCYSNDECPFYKSNKNYDNDRGGCLNGFCEMPLNVQNLTYRHYNKLTKPFCYNCKNNKNTCCDIQMEENPKLLSPDYTFVGDKIERYNKRAQLKEKGLEWYTINQQKIEI